VQLTNKVAVVTGAARGLGRAYVEALAAEGAAVVAADLNDCSDSVAAVEAAGGQAIAATVDVADGDSCQNMAELAMQAFGRVDILINNAALYAGLKGARFEQLDEDQWDRVMRVNIKGTWLTSRAVVGHMRASGGGSIINIASLAACIRPTLRTRLCGVEGSCHWHDARHGSRTWARPHPSQCSSAVGGDDGGHRGILRREI
jgi:NAD(P)-dependent dehydrogenase (short-subunit alcohol dehydrogenase family)